MSRPSAIKVGALTPLSKPGWVHAGRHLLAGVRLATRELNKAGGLMGRPLELVVGDTAADPARSAALVDELTVAGVEAFVGEYHSVAAQAVAKTADRLRMPYVCSSAVIDALVDRPSAWVARIAPPQSVGWRIYAEFLLRAGHDRVIALMDPSVYWTSGIEILTARLSRNGGSAVSLNIADLTTAQIIHEVVASRATAALLLTGRSRQSAEIVARIRDDERCAGLMIGAPAGQPEFADWVEALGLHVAELPFLQYRPDRLGAIGAAAELALRDELGAAPSFVALEGYDAMLTLAGALNSMQKGDRDMSDAWRRVDVVGTRGRISLEPVPSGVWQWREAPIQVAERDPSELRRIRVLEMACLA